MTENQFTESAQVFDQIVRKRQSIRLFDKTPVPEAVVQHCLDLALLAPNSSNMQPWEFYWVRTASLRIELVKACLSQAAAATAAELIVCVGRTQNWKPAREDTLNQLEEFRKQGLRIPNAVSVYYQTSVPQMYTMGFLGILGRLKKIFFFFKGLRKPTMREPTTPSEMKIWATKSTALACENLMLAFQSHGFDTCCMEGFDSVRVHKLLKLPKDAIIPMVIAVGKRRPETTLLPRMRADRSRYIREV